VIGMTKTYSLVPSYLKNLPNWVQWQLVERDGKKTKIPYSLNGRPASSVDKSTWHKFDEIKHCTPCKDHGAGFCFDGSGIVGIDLDHCLTSSGEVIEKFKDVVDLLDSYIEKSPSGTGLHLLMRCNTPPYPSGKRKNFEDGTGIEIYSSGRYFTITGEKWTKSTEDIEEIPPELVRMVCDPFFSVDAKPALPPQGFDDDEILALCKKAKNWEKIEDLLSGGWVGEYRSESEADLALVSLLAFYTQDAGQIERLMRSSGLARQKWDQHKSYLPDTIRLGISKCTKHYTKPTQKRQQKPDIDGFNDGSTAAMVAAAEQQTQTYYGERFAKFIESAWRYNVDARHWIHWNGKFWELDEKDSINNLCRTFLLDQLRSIGDTSTDDEIEVEIKTITKLNTAKGIRDIIFIATPILSIKEKELDTQDYMLNLGNGILDLKDLGLHPHDPDYLMSKCAGVNYDPEAKCPSWERHINDVFEGNSEIIKNVQEILGYSLFYGNPNALFSIFVGSGRNGKSVTIDTVQHVMGTYATTVNPACLMDSGGNAGSDRMKMNGARLIIASEPGDTSKGRCSLDSGFIKSATGSDRISSRRLYCESVEFSVGGLVIIVTNVLPQIRDQSVAMRERVWAVPFDHFFPQNERIENIRETLFHEGSGILNWLIEGYKRYSSTRKLIQCKAIASQTLEYLDDEDVYSPFMHDSGLIRKPGLTIGAATLYRMYKEWHFKQGFETAVRSETAFFRHMGSRFTKKHTENGNVYNGIGIEGQNNII